MRSRRQRIYFLVAGWLMLGLSPFAGLAHAEYPDRPITLMVAFEAGGSLDLLVRSMVPGVEKELKQPLIIENKGGGGGTLALSVMSTTKPDGYTITAAASTGVVRAPQLQKVPYKPLKDFMPVVAFGAVQNALVVRNDAPWKSLKNLVEYARNNPGKVRCGSVGSGSAQHHAIEVITHKDKVKIIHIPYKGGGPAITALLGGHIEACSLGPIFASHAKAGSVRVLALEEGKRSPDFPDVPTMKELGYDFENDTYYCILGPAGLPPDVVKKLEAAFTKAMEAPEFKTMFVEMGMAPGYLNSTDFDRYLKDLWPKLEKSMRETGLIEKSATDPY